MDPLSAISSSVGLIDVLYRVGSYIKNVTKEAATIEKDLDDLQSEIEALADVKKSLERLREGIKQASEESQIVHPPQALEFWDSVEKNRTKCKKVVEKLEKSVKDIIGKSQIDKELTENQPDSEKDQNPKPNSKDLTPSRMSSKPTGVLDGIRKTMRKQSTYPELGKIHMSLSKYYQGLQILLSCLATVYTQGAQKATDHLSSLFSNKINNLERQIKSLELIISSSDDANLRNIIAAASRFACKPLNKHFSLPRPVTSSFVGREALLERLLLVLDDKSLEESKVQKRFVVQGLGGSGKTEFCSKFAQLNRQKFWGVFIINASTKESAKQSFKTILKIGGVEPNEHAAKTWLSSLEEPWLLIIDNADDPEVNIEEYFPEGERGFILVTTRVFINIQHGTAGPKYYQFEKLETDAATDLLLGKALVKRPWDEQTRDLANKITSALGYLPLALVYAGTAISNRLCELGNYLRYFKMSWEEIRQLKRDNNQTDHKDPHMSVYSSYEVIYRKLEEDIKHETKDAVELLKMFSFYSRENITFDSLVAAAQNPGLEAAAEKKAEKEKNSKGLEKPKSWLQWFKTLLFGLRTEILKGRSRPVVPNMLHDFLRGSIDIKRFEFRLRGALHILEKWSLVMYYEDKNSYSLHPLVHVWVRERPQMTLRDQAVWPQAATTVLGQSIRLPIFGTLTTKEMELNRSLLLHIIHLRERKKEIRENYYKNRNAHGRLLPAIKPKSDTEVTDRLQSIQAAKFSYIYFICDRWEEAEKKYFKKHLRDGRFNDAADLTEQVLQAAEKSLGNRHPTTLNIMAELANSRNFQGQFPEAQDLLERAIEGMKEVHGENHQETLCAIDNHGQVHWCIFSFEKAKDYHLQALKGMKSHPQMGEDHDRTWATKENLAMTYRELGEADFDEAETLMTEVIEKRQKILGRESPHTLIAQSNIAYIKHAMGKHAEAEEIIRKGLPVADRNLGEDHHGVMSARSRLAEILTAQKKFDEAEKIYRQVLDKEKYSGGVRREGVIKGDFKDRIFVLFKFMLFWEVQDKGKEAIETCEELCLILKDSVHPIAQIAKDKLKNLQSRFESSESVYESDDVPSNCIER